MQRCGNLGGDSGVAAYEIGPGAIAVRFRGGAARLYTYAYTYTYAVTGRVRCRR